MNSTSLNPKISIVAVNYNGTEYTRQFLYAMRKVTYPNFDVWIVDNNSPQPCHELQTEFPEANFIFSTQNLGFAGGNNLAIVKCQADIIGLVNNDTIPDPDFLNPIATLFQSDDKIGIVGAKMIYHSPPQLIQFAGSKGFNYFTGRAFSIGNKHADSPVYQQNYPSQLAHGAGMFIHQKVFQQIGLMFEDYFLYYEELDFCERAKRAGFSIWFCGQSRILHLESMSTGKASKLKLYYLNRNRLLFLRRNATGLKKYLSITWFLLLAFPKTLIQQLINRQWDKALALIQGLWWNIRYQIPKDKMLKH